MTRPYMKRSRTIPRREFLRGAGVALALPMLECMRPAFARERSSEPRRMLVIFKQPRRAAKTVLSRSIRT